MWLMFCTVLSWILLYARIVVLAVHCTRVMCCHSAGVWCHCRRRLSSSCHWHNWWTFSWVNSRHMSAASSRTTTRDLVSLGVSLCLSLCAGVWVMLHVQQSLIFVAVAASLIHIHLIVPRTRLSTISDRSFSVTVALAWNSLPTSITALTSLPSFKRQLKTFLFTKSFPSV